MKPSVRLGPQEYISSFKNALLPFFVDKMIKKITSLSSGKSSEAENSQSSPMWQPEQSEPTIGERPCSVFG